MDSMFWPATLFVVLLLALLATIAFLATQQSRSTRETMTHLQKLQDSQMKQMEAQQEATRMLAVQMLQQLSSQTSSAQADTLSYLQTQNEQVMLMLSSTVTQVTREQASTARELVNLASASQAMIASKDAMAFQAVRGASAPLTSDSGTGPYTSTEALAMADAISRKAESDRTADAALQMIHEMTGVKNVDPYPVAGTHLFGGPAPAAQ